jgi:hypothetical protein
MLRNAAKEVTELELGIDSAGGGGSKLMVMVVKYGLRTLHAEN